jgi:hypothetical protein
MQGRDLAVIDASMVRISAEPKRIPVPSDGATNEASVDVMRHGDAVAGVEVTCTCGNCIRLRFEYGASG